MAKNTEENRKKRIAFYIGSLCKGGAERVIRNLAQYFYDENYEVYMVTKLKDEEEYDLYPEIPRIIADITPEEETGRRLGNLLARINKLKGIWKEIKPDVIVSFIKKNNLMALASASSLGIPVIVSVRSAPERELSGRGVKQLSFYMFKKAAGIVLQTSQARDYFPAGLQKNSIILPNSINREFVEYLNTHPINENEEKEDLRIITVGRIDNNKNQKMLVEAFMQLDLGYNKWTLHLYGDGEARTRLEKTVADSNYSDRIIFHGAINNVPEEMAKADIFVLPSKVEGMPNALIEAMAMGKACISTDCPCGGPADLIDNGESGLLIPVDDTAALLAAMKKLMDDRKLREAIGKKASEIRLTLSPDVVNKRWKEYIESKI